MIESGNGNSIHYPGELGQYHSAHYSTLTRQLNHEIHANKKRANYVLCQLIGAVT